MPSAPMDRPRNTEPSARTRMAGWARDKEDSARRMSVAQVTKFRRAACANPPELECRNCSRTGARLQRQAVNSAPVDRASGLQMLQPAVHVEFGQLGEAADAGAVDHDLRHGARAVGDDREFLHRLAVEVDADLVVADAALVEKGLGLDADGAGAGAVDLDGVHGGFLVHTVLRWLFQAQYIAHVVQTGRAALQPFCGAQRALGESGAAAGLVGEF